MRNILTLASLIVILLSCKETNKTERPIEPWVFRSVLDETPRIVTAALSDEIWVAYDARTASLFKACPEYDSE